MILKLGGWVGTRQSIRLIKYNTQINKNDHAFRATQTKCKKKCKKISILIGKH